MITIRQYTFAFLCLLTLAYGSLSADAIEAVKAPTKSIVVKEPNRYDDMLSLLRSVSSGPEDVLEIPIERIKKVVGNTSFGVLRMTVKQAREQALQMMSEHDAKGSQRGDVTFPVDAWESLNILTGSHSVLDSISTHTQTYFGPLFLARLLTTPTTNIGKLSKRQDLIKSLSQTPELKTTLETLCSAAGELQDHLIGITSPQHPLYDEGLKLYHHKWFLHRILPSHKRGWATLAKLGGDAWIGAGPIAFALAVNKLRKGTLSPVQYKSDSGKEVRKIKKTDGSDRGNTEQWESKSQALTRMTGFKSANVARALSAFFAAYFIYHGINTGTWQYKRFKAIHYMYHQLRPLKQFFKILSVLRKYAERVPALKAIADEVDFDINMDDPDLLRLKKILRGPAFKHELSAQLAGGDVVIAVDLLHKCRSKIMKGVGLLGAIDGYCGLATWYQKNRTNLHTPVSMAQLTKADAPFVQLNQFWHPSVARSAPDSLVLNSMSLGKGIPLNAIITGLFESGKSTFLHAIALCILCAQSIGIVPAQFCNITPFAAINVYANVKDDIANDRSLFKTELFRALQLLTHIKNLPQGQFSFSIADATFTGTEAGAGQAAAYAVARYLGNLDNSVALHATNFLSLSRLGKENPQKFTNYFLPSFYNDRTEHSYILTPGTQEPLLSTAIFKEEKLPQNMIDIMEQELSKFNMLRKPQGVQQ